MDLKKHWNNVAEEINKRERNQFLVGYDSVLDQYIRGEFEKIFRKLDIFKSSILEVGSGAGANLEICLEKNSKRIVACDISDKLLNLAKSRLNKKCEFILIDGESIPLDNDEINSSFTVTVLQHISNEKMLKNLISEICRVTSSNVVLFEDIAPEGNGIKSEDYVVRDFNTYKNLMEENGFKLKKQSIIGLRYSLKILGAINSLFLYKKMEGSKSSFLEDYISKVILRLTSKLDKIEYLNKRDKGLCILEFIKKN